MTLRWPRTMRRLRRDAGLSLREAGRLLGVSAVTVTRWEKGQRTMTVPRFVRAVRRYAKAARRRRG